MDFLEGNALGSSRRLGAMPDDGRIVAERPHDDLGARAPALGRQVVLRAD